jgi:hypothetical protein
MNHLVNFLRTYYKMPPFLKYANSTSVSNRDFTWNVLPVSITINIMYTCSNSDELIDTQIVSDVETELFSTIET